jgi:hypothetical protein
VVAKACQPACSPCADEQRPSGPTTPSCMLLTAKLATIRQERPMVESLYEEQARFSDLRQLRVVVNLQCAGALRPCLPGWTVMWSRSAKAAPYDLLLASWHVSQSYGMHFTWFGSMRLLMPGCRMLDRCRSGGPGLPVPNGVRVSCRADQLLSAPFSAIWGHLLRSLKNDLRSMSRAKGSDPPSCPFSCCLARSE